MVDYMVQWRYARYLGDAGPTEMLGEPGGEQRGKGSSLQSVSIMTSKMFHFIKVTSVVHQLCGLFFI